MGNTTTITTENILPFLVETGYITEEIKTFVEEQAELTNQSAIDALIASNLAGTKKDLVAFLLKQEGYQYVSLDKIDVDDEAASKLERDMAFALTSLPYAYKEGRLYIAVPINKVRDVQLKTDLRKATGEGVIELVASSRDDIIQAIDSVYKDNIDLGTQEEEVEEEGIDIPDELVDEEESLIITFVNKVLEKAVKDGASDIHFDPREEGMVIRFRVSTEDSS